MCYAGYTRRSMTSMITSPRGLRRKRWDWRWWTESRESSTTCGPVLRYTSPQPPSFTSLWKFTDLIGDYIILAETNGLVDQWRSWSLLTCPLCHSSLCLIQQSILLFVYKPANFYELQPCILFPVISLLHRTPFGSWYRRHLGQCCTHWHTEDHADRAGCFKVCIRA